jgi:hypothetical protein
VLDQVPMESDRGVDYRKLREYLQQQNWQAADQETYERLLEAELVLNPNLKALHHKMRWIGFPAKTYTPSINCQ